MTWLRISPEVSAKCFKKCCMSNAMDRLIYRGMAVKRLGMLEVSMRKTKALTVKMETVTLPGKGR